MHIYNLKKNELQSAGEYNTLNWDNSLKYYEYFPQVVEIMNKTIYRSQI